MGHPIKHRGLRAAQVREKVGGGPGMPAFYIFGALVDSLASFREVLPLPFEAGS
jgi:hypothetical protein